VEEIILGLQNFSWKFGKKEISWNIQSIIVKIMLKCISFISSMNVCRL